ncbi:MAG: hypothetical protein IPG93_00525 [Burkholderiales bacterium]|nr:hypothetical protein [Burkholderiales bacterium]
MAIANVENVTLTGTGNIDAAGDASANVLTGNAGNNHLNGLDGNDVLNGGAGVDTLAGGLGNDTYVVDSVTDVIVENLNEGTDTLQSSVSIAALAANVENLVLTGGAAINGVGNDLANRLNGNPGANTLTGGVGNDMLDGGVGADRLVGGVGNDLYFVDSALDVVVEAIAGRVGRCSSQCFIHVVGEYRSVGLEWFRKYQWHGQWDGQYDLWKRGCQYVGRRRRP